MHKDNILKLRAEGKSYNEISKELGCSKGTIAYHVGAGQKEKYHQRSQKRRTEVRAILARIKEESGCVDCKIKYPFYVLEFDHTQDNKEANIAWMATFASIEDILKETAKCEVVCANCHKARTYLRKQNKTYKINADTLEVERVPSSYNGNTLHS